MELPPAISGLRRFLHLAQEREGPSNEALARALDELALSFHDCPPGRPAEGDAEPPADDFDGLRAALGSRFPDFGYYASSDPRQVLDDEPAVGDAMDDLADIVRDLRQVSWRYDALGADDAHWHFRLGFQTHWGEHLRSLARYLHAKRFG